VLQGVLVATALLGGTVFVVLLLRGNPALGRMSLIGAPFFTVTVAAVLLPRRFLRTRASLLLASLYVVGTSALLTVGYHSGPALTLALVVVAGALFFGARALGFLLAGTAISFALCGVAVTSGWVPAVDPMANDMTSLANWLETSVNYFLITGITATSVAYVIRRIEATVREREEAQRALESTQQALLRSQKMEALGQLAGGVAHDFNNLLTVILGYADGLQQRGSDDPEFIEDMNQIVESAERASKLTGQLLAVSRQQSALLEPVDVNTVVAGMHSMLSRLVGEEVQLRLDLANDLGPALTNRSQLEQVILNLVVNGRDAMPRGGRILISTQHELLEEDSPDGLGAGTYVRLSVEDEGEGISAEVQAKMFDPFFTTKDLGAGTGLGLSLVYGIATQSGGDVRVSSSPGRGTRFDVWLPRSYGAPAKQRVQPEAPRRQTGRGTRVLIVEDEPRVRELVSRSLLDEGYEVLVASDGTRALELARDVGPVDLLLTDVRMPGMNGFELAERLRERNPHVKVLFMSGYAQDESGTPEDLSEDQLLAKPFTPRELISKLGELTAPATSGSDDSGREGA
jgi:signal transduction histidine kinase